MNWIKANKFLTGFFAVMLVGVVVLGYLVFSARSRYDEATTDYTTKSEELNRLLGSAPYPDAKNVEAMEAQRKEHRAKIIDLEKGLAANQLPVEPMSDVEFQDKLKETVSRVVAKANEKGMKLPEKGFYMGFDRYQTEPPRADAAPLLGRQLKAIELVMSQLIENSPKTKPISLNKLEREPLPEEGDRPGRKADEKAAKGTVAKHTVDIGFSADQNSFRGVLNNLVSSKAQFYIPRRIDVKNEKDKGPSRSELTAPAIVSTPAPPVPAAPGVPAVPTPSGGVPPAPTQSLKLIVGDERVEVSMRLEIVDFPIVAAK